MIAKKQTYSTLDNFNVFRTLGSGVMGKVKLGQDRKTEEFFALKIIIQDDQNSLECLKISLEKEYKILKKLSHPSIIKIFDLKMDALISKKTGLKRKCYYAVVELAIGGDFCRCYFSRQRIE